MDNMQGEDTLGNFEVYIPEEAEVKTIPLWTLPVSTLRRMGLPSLPCGSAKERSHASATWISPVVIRERNCSPTKCDTQDTAKAKMTSLLTHERTSASGPYLMPFVTSSCTAFSVLGKFLPHRENPKQHSPGRMNPIPCGELPHPYQDAVIIHHGRIYLSVKKSKSTKSVRGTSNSCLSSPASSPLQTTERNLVSPPPAAAKSQESCPVPPDYNAAMEKTLLQRFGVTRQIYVALTRVTQSADHIEQEKANNLSCFQTGSEEEISSDTEQSNVADNSEQGEGAGDMSNSEEVEGAEDMSNSEEVEGAEDMSNSEEVEGAGDMSNSEEVEGAGDMSNSEEVEGAEDVSNSEQVEGAMDVSTGDSDESWMAEFPQMLSFTPNMGLRHTFDFEQSAREEAIDRIRAKLRESEAALNNLPR